MLSEINEDGVYRLAAAVVKGLPANDPERAEWERFGENLRSRIFPPLAQETRSARRVGRMDALEGADDRVVHGRRRRRR